MVNNIIEILYALLIYGVEHDNTIKEDKYIETLCHKLIFNLCEQNIINCRNIQCPNCPLFGSSIIRRVCE